jgi:hypothetical protein
VLRGPRDVLTMLDGAQGGQRQSGQQQPASNYADDLDGDIPF